ncbi:PREDICTED: uncharacterized protein LOC108562984 [Nicrophorus vespilloides]|uniref:Uncharacterized protein LOC108562984 n=1 Tax=Nicrophorus vespilloides TaxID=110193 RepID=A0ABM1MQZ1_NICVS|nr:PREDICTED: uncharacterized protein LOC108562984 [Nicrophorus vespilloides]
MQVSSIFVLVMATLSTKLVSSEDYNVQQVDGSYEFGYDGKDSFHHSKANRKNVVRGEFGGRNPQTGGVDVTSYTAGPRGYRPRGKNIVRKFDQNQNGPRPIGSRDDPYFDPNEDPSYNFSFKTRTYSRTEGANRRGDVTGKYTYVDDVGERHNVEYIAGKNTGFHVKTPFPDSNPRSYGPLFFNGRGRPLPRGRTSIQRGLDGSYRFVSAGPDQRRTETSDASGNVRGSYTYLDDKGVQHSVHYIAGPNIGYRVLKNVKGPHLPTVYPFAGQNIVPSDFYDYLDKNTQTDIFDTAASGRPKPVNNGNKYNPNDDTLNFDDDKPNRKPFGGFNKPTYEDDGEDISDIDHLFKNPGNKPSASNNNPSSTLGNDDSVADDADDGDDDDLFSPNAQKPSYKPRPSQKPISRPQKPISRPQNNKPNYDLDNNDDDDSLDSDFGLFGSSSNSYKPKPTASKPAQRPQKPKPSYNDYGNGGDDDDNNSKDFGLFGSTSSSTHKPPTLSISSDRNNNKQHTIVTNIGDTLFTVPPGVSVQAHVQSIDLFPYESKVPSPSDIFRAEVSSKLTQRKAELEITTVPSATETTPVDITTTK